MTQTHSNTTSRKARKWTWSCGALARCRFALVKFASSKIVFCIFASLKSISVRVDLHSRQARSRSSSPKSPNISTECICSRIAIPQTPFFPYHFPSHFISRVSPLSAIPPLSNIDRPAKVDSWLQGVLRVSKWTRAGPSSARSLLDMFEFCNFLHIFGGLVLGCIKTKFCKKICV